VGGALCIRGGDIPPLGDDPGRTGATLLISEGRIAAIGGPELRRPDGARVWDATGCDLLPGLVNAHNHLAMTLLRGYGADLPLDRWLRERIWPVEERLIPEDVRQGALLGCLELLRGGVTAVADMYDRMDAVADAVLASGIRGVLSRGIVGLHAGWERALAEAEELCARARRDRSGRLQAMISPHAEYTCPPPVWEACLAVARRERVPLHTHVAETADEVQGCRRRHGVGPVRFLAEVGALEAGCLCAHCVHLDPGDIALLAAPGVAVAHNPVSNAKLGSGIAPLPALLAGGVVVGLGSDGAASTDFLGLWEEMRLAAWQQKALHRDAAAVPCAALLHLATAGGASALGLPAGCGHLAVGAPADLIAVDRRGLHRIPATDPRAGLVYGTRDADVVLTVVAGRVVMERGEFLGIDHEQLAADVAARSGRLLGAARRPGEG
jgi:5-methylthioadenosine/S-adenosylhomocysteine deaminase